MEPDREPQAAGEHDAGCKENPGLEHYRHSPKQSRIRIDEVQAAEDQAGYPKAQPGAQRLLQDAKHDAAKENLLKEG